MLHLQGDAPEADVLRRVSESDDGMEDSVPDLIDYDQVRESEDVESVFKTEIDKIITDLDAEYPTFLFSEEETRAQQALDVLPLLVLPSKEHSIGSASSAR